MAHAPAVLVLAMCAMVATACGDAAAARRALATQYLAIATAGNHRLDKDFDALDGADHDDLAAATADLRDIADTERTFDRQLLALALTSDTRATAMALVAANETRARLTTQTAAATTLDELHAGEPRLKAANAPVERQVEAIRRELGLPPPDTS
jgi:hypothetical protein